MNNLRTIASCFFLMLTLSIAAQNREKLNFNANWLLYVGDAPDAASSDFDDSPWESVTLPRAFNEDEAFARDIAELTDTIMWYRKHFKVDNPQGKNYFIEFEGVRQAGEFWLNGHRLGMSNNGVMACGFDLTPYVVEGDNVVAVRIDNSWTYRDPIHESRFQWNDRNFNANYGGIPKNVWLHVTGLLYQTLPLYSNLGTTGTYVYATDIDVAARKAVVNVESEVRNSDVRERVFRLVALVTDADGEVKGRFIGDHVRLNPGETRIVKASSELYDLHFWSWGYGYLYTVSTFLQEANGGGDMLVLNDEVKTRTGFRKTHFGDGKIWLNDRVLMVHGYAQRTSNEWPSVGISVPAWMSDYSNRLMVESGGNLVRWMHVTPWKQDVESCDRVGLLQAMPAGDAEKDVEGARWQQRMELMRDAIIYNRNNPSIVFYECGNKGISREHMIAMKALRDQYDPNGGRAIGSREMLDINEAEYGGEMLYINKSAKHPMWAMEYCRDEGLRRYWDQWSPPYHPEGAGPLYRG
ncbi:MAG: beta-galactosidase, partial [Prevotella sp.]|nr:beta-galactosidase [Prevotella sp.]